MKRLILIGGGGHCKSVLDAAIRMNEFEEIVITDAHMERGTVMGCRIVGDDSVLPDYYNSGYTNAFVTVGNIGDSNLRKKLVDMASKIGYGFPKIIDPSATVSEYADIDDGVFVGKGAIINAECVIGRHSIINTGAIVEHDCHIGEHSHVAVGARICGGSIIGDESFVGAGATIVQGVNVRNKSFIKAGSLIT